jgi:FkbM family methyltransferase
MKHLIKEMLRVFGYEIKKITSSYVDTPFEETENGKFVNLLGKHSIDLIFDVGANNGTWALELRESGYNGEIVSIEPYQKSYNLLKEKAVKDNKWETLHCAIGDYVGKTTLYIANNTLSSSLCKMTDKHLEGAKDSKYVGSEKVDVKKLDNYVSKVRGKNVFIKIDTQGFEKRILKGSSLVMPNVKGLQVEMSFKKLYEDEIIFFEMLDYINELGFNLQYLNNGFKHEKTGELLQVDGIFYRNHDNLI